MSTPGHTGGMRLFVAVDPSPTAEAALRALPRPTSHDLRRTTPDQWHVNVRFLGDVEDDGPVIKALARLPAQVAGAATEARMGPATAWFPGRRILHAPVTGLESVAKEVERLTAAWGTATVQPFVGHLTLARTRGGAPGPRGLAGAILQGKFDVRRVVLYASTLAPQGAFYEARAAVHLPAASTWATRSGGDGPTSPNDRWAQR